MIQDFTYVLTWLITADLVTYVVDTSYEYCVSQLFSCQPKFGMTGKPLRARSRIQKTNNSCGIATGPPLLFLRNCEQLFIIGTRNCIFQSIKLIPSVPI